MSHTSLSDNVLFYLILSRAGRKIFQYIYWYQNRYPNKAFPSMVKIALFAGISVRGVQKFFKSLEKRGDKENYLRVIPRFKKNGGKTTNEYKLNNNFKSGMDWLNIHHKLNTPRKNTKSIILSMEKQQKVHLPLPQKFTTLSKDCSFSKDQTTGEAVWINPLVRELGIDAYAKLFASQCASDHEIVDTLEACRYQEKKRKLDNPSAYFIGTLKNKIAKKTL